MNKVQKGFTLIELMIVVAIIGILAAVALPMYQDFQRRSKVSEALGALAACKTSVSEFYASNNGWTTPSGVGISANLCTTASQYVSALAVGAAGVMTVTTQNIGGGADGTIDMSPTIAGGTITAWVCGGGATSVPPKFRPGSCQG